MDSSGTNDQVNYLVISIGAGTAAAIAGVLLAWLKWGRHPRNTNEGKRAKPEDE